MARRAVKGCLIGISTTVVTEKDIDFVVGDFSALTYTNIAEWTTMGNVGDEAADITSQIISAGRDKRAKGSRAAPAIENIFNWDITDPGQLALMAAEKTDNNYAFKMELNDKPAAGASPKNSILYFMGLVSVAQHVGGGANTLRTLRGVILPNSNIVTVAASAT